MRITDLTHSGNTLPDDNELHRQVSEEATKIIEKVLSSKPASNFWRGLKRISIYDLRGVSARIPRLGLAFVFPTVSFGVSKQTSGPFDVIIIMPSLLLDSLNKDIAASQSSLHHELVHILMRHEDQPESSDYHKNRDAYFNHRIEIDAYFHQGIVDAKAADWSTFESFRQAFIKAVYKPFWKALTAENRQEMERRLEAFWEKREQS